MESLLVRALESKLRYWLRSFTREQFKLQGRTVQLCNLDINGEVLHSGIGLPPSLLVSQARVGRLEIKLPSLSNVQMEPIVVEIDKLDLVLVEKSNFEHETFSCGTNGSSMAAKSSGYGFADKIADGMTLQVGTVNLMLETRGGATGHEGAAWTPPLAAITIRKMMLYTTNEYWQVVNLKDARDFSNNKKCIYVFKKLDWESISVDLLPHPNMFTDERLSSSQSGELGRDNDGAKRLFFGGERFLDNISGEACITIQRTEQNNPLGMEVQVRVPEAICAALSEPGLRAFLRFMTGLYICMNRGDVGPRYRQSTEAAGRTMVAVIVEHVFICIKDADFQLEFLLQCLHYMRASTTTGESTKTLTQISVGGFFLRDTFSYPPCTLVQPGIRNICNEALPVPKFASEKLWPRMYPLGIRCFPMVENIPLLCVHSLQTVPSPSPPSLASQTVIQCQPLKMYLQEVSCLRIASFLADGVVIEHGVVIPDTSLTSMQFGLKEFNITIPVDNDECHNDSQEGGFTGARLHVEGFAFIQAPCLTYRILKLDTDPACFLLWHGQPVDASQRRWTMQATQVSVALQAGSCDDTAQSQNAEDCLAGLWCCVEIREPCIEAAMVTSDGCPLVSVPPPGGIVRFTMSCKYCNSIMSTVQLFFVLKMYGYVGKVCDSLHKVSKGQKKVVQKGTSRPLSLIKDMKKMGSVGAMIEMAPSDTIVSLGADVLEFKFVESPSGQGEVEGPPLVKISGSGLSLMIAHRTLGGAVAISSKLLWQDIIVECVEGHDQNCSNATSLSCKSSSEVDEPFPPSQITRNNDTVSSLLQTNPKICMRAIFWIGERKHTPLSMESVSQSSKQPFLDIDVENVIPYREEDADCHSLNVTAKIYGVHLGGGMVYNEYLLHRFGILGPDGRPGKAVNQVLKNLSSGPFADLIRPPPQTFSEGSSDGIQVETIDNENWLPKHPDDVNIDLQLQNWVLALEGTEIVSEPVRPSAPNLYFPQREERCWHATFRCFHAIAQGGCKFPATGCELKNAPNRKAPVQRIILAIDGLETIKPSSSARVAPLAIEACAVSNDHKVPWGLDSCRDSSFKCLQQTHALLSKSLGNHSGLDFEVRLAIRGDEADADINIGHWVVESLKAAVKEPVEVEATKQEVEDLICLFKSEIESASRIIAGIMQLLKLQGSIGQAAIDQLNSLGSGSLSRFITEGPKQQIGTGGATGSQPSNGTLHESLNPAFTISRIEQAVCKTQEMCLKLNVSLAEACSFTDKPGSITEVTAMLQQLEAMQTLLGNLRNEL